MSRIKQLMNEVNNTMNSIEGHIDQRINLEEGKDKLIIDQRKLIEDLFERIENLESDLENNK